MGVAGKQFVIDDDHTVGDLEVGNWIATWRVNNGWSRKQLAFAVGVDESTMSRMENGKVRIYADTLFHIARILNEPVLYVPPRRLHQGEPGGGVTPDGDWET